MVKCVIAQTKRAKKFGHPVAGYVGRIQKLVDVRNGRTVAGVAMRCECSKVVDHQHKHCQQKDLGESVKGRRPGENQSKHDPDSHHCEQLPESVLRALLFGSLVVFVPEVDYKRSRVL